MENEIIIRPMQEEDLDTLARIYVKVYEHFDVGERWTVKTAKELLSYWFGRQPDLAFVAVDGTKIIGAFIAGVKPWWDGNHLTDGELFVDPGFQGRGVGTMLSIALYQTALKKYNVTCFDTITFKKTEFPLSWYKAQGFEENENWVAISGDVKKILKELKQ